MEVEDRQEENALSNLLKERARDASFKPTQVQQDAGEVQEQDENPLLKLFTLRVQNAFVKHIPAKRAVDGVALNVTTRAQAQSSYSEIKENELILS